MGFLKVVKSVKSGVSSVVDVITDNPFTNAVATVTDTIVTAVYNVSADIGEKVNDTTKTVLKNVGEATGLDNVVHAVGSTWVGDVLDTAKDWTNTAMSATSAVMNDGLVKSTVIESGKGFVNGFLTSGNFAGAIAGAVVSTVSAAVAKYTEYGINKYVEGITEEKFKELNADLEKSGLRITKDLKLYDAVSGEYLGHFEGENFIENSALLENKADIQKDSFDIFLDSQVIR